VLGGTVGLDQPHVEIERSRRDRRAVVHRQRERIAVALRMLDDGAQHGRGGNAAERTDESPIVSLV
jgi:hypothetical protein